MQEWLIAGNGDRFRLSPDGYWIMWEKRSPTYADTAHRGLVALANRDREREREKGKQMSNLEERSPLGECVCCRATAVLKLETNSIIVRYCRTCLVYFFGWVAVERMLSELQNGGR